MQMLADKFSPDYLTGQRDPKVPQWVKGLVLVDACRICGGCYP